MDKHDIWQWTCIMILKFWENLNDVLACVLVILNIIWVSARLFDWMRKKMRKRLL